MHLLASICYPYSAMRITLAAINDLTMMLNRHNYVYMHGYNNAHILLMSSVAFIFILEQGIIRKCSL